MAIATADPALSAYEALAPFYDRFTSDYTHARWVPRLVGIAQDLGLAGQRVLDIGCGTGKSFLPLVEHGYEVTACDMSPAMVDAAREAALGTDAEVLVADARDLPELGRFDLVTAINDALNYVLTEFELAAVFDSVARNLRPGGLVVFDLNTLRCFREFFSRDDAFETDDAFFCWRGEGEPDAQPGVLASAMIEIFSTEDGDCWRRTRSQHVQRHHPPELVERLLREAGLEVLERRGQITGDRVDRVGDEDVHVKLVYFARRQSGTSASASREWG